MLKKVGEEIVKMSDGTFSYFCQMIGPVDFVLDINQKSELGDLWCVEVRWFDGNKFQISTPGKIPRPIPYLEDEERMESVLLEEILKELWMRYWNK